MTNCPACQAEINEDFGLVHCPNCSAVIMIDMDGQAQLQETQEDVGLQEGVFAEVLTEELNDDWQQSEEAAAVETGTEPTGQEGAYEEVNAIEEDPKPESLADWQQSEEAAAVETSTEPTGQEGAYEEVNAIEEDPKPESLADWQQSEEAAAIETSTEPTGQEGAYEEVNAIEKDPKPESLADELTAFANSSTTNEGHLRYCIFISGLDSPEIRENFINACTDKKFVWDAEQLLQQINNGHLKLENISPVKASILIKRIKNMPLHIRWEQYEVHSQ